MTEQEFRLTEQEFRLQADRALEGLPDDGSSIRIVRA